MISEADENLARDAGYEACALTFDDVLFGEFKGRGLLPEGSQSGRLTTKTEDESEVKILVANGMLAFIAQVYLKECGKDSAQAMIDFATMLHWVATDWADPNGKKPTKLTVLPGGKSP